ncbi:F0F1 ATP synthase subunit A [Patescibacteria group bacterium]|nr:F0F1 ATP synthase subunit A [Patescibacteria group bacterium]MBU1663479.1 F0F1 ATP synthase subunit A [Patescibacteria group bacterium]MBU1933724.1 F0F1 ATP synthase subunit A [Patescibacteria group bacterium]MBU2007670.1 F0F1 ATP synthase subunit A [Patescibacteria group bacterium]MBU2233612.1 F0F1 ATP synthase subunit A [Patescibacteria group bacterium]
MELSISLAPDILFNIGSMPITNTLFWSFFVSLFLIVITLIINRSLKSVPGTLQNIVEILIEGSYLFVQTITGSNKKTKYLFPLVFTMFIFIAIANIFVFIPGQSAITLDNGEGSVPLFRAVMSDYGMVFILTIISIIAMQVAAIATNGPFKYIGKFLNFKGPLEFFLGLMDFIGELAKILSLSFRLFGNIFAGETLTAVLLFLLPFIAPLPFMFLGILTAIVQAFVFATLTLVFVTMASEKV